MILSPREGRRCLIGHLIERSRGKKSEYIDSNKVEQGLETQVQQGPRNSTILQVEQE